MLRWAHDTGIQDKQDTCSTHFMVSPFLCQCVHFAFSVCSCLCFLQTFTGFHHSQAWQVKQSPLFVYVVLALAVGRPHLNCTVSSWPFKQCSEWAKLSKANWPSSFSQFKLKMCHDYTCRVHLRLHVLTLPSQNKQSQIEMVWLQNIEQLLDFVKFKLWPDFSPSNKLTLNYLLQLVFWCFFDNVFCDTSGSQRAKPLFFSYRVSVGLMFRGDVISFHSTIRSLWFRTCDDLWILQPNNMCPVLQIYDSVDLLWAILP